MIVRPPGNTDVTYALSRDHSLPINGHIKVAKQDTIILALPLIIFTFVIK